MVGSFPEPVPACMDPSTGPTVGQVVSPCHDNIGDTGLTQVQVQVPTPGSP